MTPFRPVFYLIGLLISGLAFIMTIPLVAELMIFQTNGWKGFAVGAFSAGSFGPMLAFANYSPQSIGLKVREAFLLTALIWIVSSFFAALPIYWSSLELPFIDAWFESVSALTTTGSTAIGNLKNTPKGILLWRSLLQWFGGTGIILMALTILPILRIGGMQLFRSEFSDRSEKILPRASQISTAILSIYTFFTFLCFLLLKMAGMNAFDALCYSMSTVSTGGLANHDESIGFFQSPLIEMIVAFFMVTGGITYILYIRLWKRQWKTVYTDPQLRGFLGILLTATGLMILWNARHTDLSWIINIRSSFFTTASIMTSSGFTTTDYGHWGSFPLFIIFMLSLVGGCTGSTAGGLKVFRLQILWSVTYCHLKQLRRQHGVYVPIYNHQKISETVAASVLSFVGLYFFVALIIVGFLTFFNLNIIDSFSAAISALSNTGIGISELLSPNVPGHPPLPSSCKLILMGGMILGRLEILTLFVLFMPSFWRS